jgi:hypothetical protein
MSTLKQRLAAAHPVLRAVALALAAVVTLGAIGGLAHLADEHYSEARVAQDLATPADNYVLVTSSPLP